MSRVPSRAARIDALRRPDGGWTFRCAFVVSQLEHIVMRTRPMARSIPFVSIFFSSLLSGCGESQDQVNQSDSKTVRPVKTVIVEATASTLTRSYPAVVLPSQQADLSFRVSGRIVELPVRAAMQVKKGDVIAQLDTRDFEAEVTRLESQLEQAKAQLSAMTSGARDEDRASLQASVNSAEAQVVAARKQVARIRTLVEKGSIARADLDKEVAQLAVAEAQFQSSKQELTKGQAGARQEEVAEQEAAIRGLETQIATARDNLDDTTLRAPFDGIVATREVDNFANIQAKERVAVLQKLETLELRFDVPGPDVSKLAGSKTISSVATLDSIADAEFEATLVEFSTQADPATQTYRGRVSITPPDNVAILPGMTGNILVSDKAQGPGTVSVPATSVASEPDGAAYVWIVSQPANTVEKRPVEVGAAAGANVSVLEGLAAGDMVVTAGVSYLQEDMTVKPISKVGD